MDMEELEFRAQDLETIEGLVVVEPNSTALARQSTMQQVKTTYVTAMAVQEPRNLAKVEKRLYQEAALLGEDAFYGWTVTDEKTGKTSLISGASIGLAMVAIRCFGNSVLDQDAPVETREAWFYPVRVIDLESGFTHTRYGRYSRRSTVYGRLDEERKERVRFEIGQSIAVRNAIDDFIPKWLMTGAVKSAKSGVRKRMEEYIKKNGIDKARTILVDRLAAKAVSLERILGKMQRATIAGLTVDDLVIMQGDAKQLEDNAELGENLYPDMEQPRSDQGNTEASQDHDPPPKTRAEATKQQMRQQHTRAERSDNPAPQAQDSAGTHTSSDDAVGTMIIDASEPPEVAVGPDGMVLEPGMALLRARGEKYGKESLIGKIQGSAPGLPIKQFHYAWDQVGPRGATVTG